MSFYWKFLRKVWIKCICARCKGHHNKNSKQQDQHRRRITVTFSILIDKNMMGIHFLQFFSFLLRPGVKSISKMTDLILMKVFFCVFNVIIWKCKWTNDDLRIFNCSFAQIIIWVIRSSSSLTGETCITLL